MAREEKSPCFGCKTRTAECHAICMAYFNWKTLHIGHAEKEKYERNKNCDANTFRIEQYMKVKKESRRR